MRPFVNHKYPGRTPHTAVTLNTPYCASDRMEPLLKDCGQGLWGWYTGALCEGCGGEGESKSVR